MSVDTKELFEKGVDIRFKHLKSVNDDYVKKHKTRVVCTLGPACWSVENLVKLIDAGMDVARFNFSHGDHKSHQECLDRLREAMKQRPEKHIMLMLDTKGPEIRTGRYKDGITTCTFEKDRPLKITTDYTYLGDEKCIACSYSKLVTTVKVGSIILIGDGSLSVRVISIGKDHVDTVILNNAKLGSVKNMCLPGHKVDLPVCGEREVNDIVNFLLPNKMHCIAPSFVQSAQDVHIIRKYLGEEGKDVKIIPKIENLAGMLAIDEIIEAADGIMVARGDLGMEMNLEKVFIAQKIMIDKCNRAGKPVIVATQILESMINAPRPTRAEICDCANAVLDGTDCVMLSGESANGAFFDKAVDYLLKASYEAEKTINYALLYNAMALHVQPEKPIENLLYNAVRIAYGAECAAIVTVTTCGITAKILSKYRPSQLILVGTTCESLASSLGLNRAVRTFLLEDLKKDNEANVRVTLKAALDQKLIDKGAMICAIFNEDPVESKTANMIKLMNA